MSKRRLSSSRINTCLLLRSEVDFRVLPTTPAMQTLVAGHTPPLKQNRGMQGEHSAVVVHPLTNCGVPPDRLRRAFNADMLRRYQIEFSGLSIELGYGPECYTPLCPGLYYTGSRRW